MTSAQLDQILAAIQSGSIPPGTLYVQFDTDLGSAAFDPFASAQDPTTQAIVRAVGIRNITIGFGAVPTPAPGTPSLLGNLKVLGLVALGGLALLIRPPWWMVGAGVLGYLALVGGGGLLPQQGTT